MLHLGLIKGLGVRANGGKQIRRSHVKLIAGFGEELLEGM